MRSFGLLLHISSLPSAFGIGDLGPAAHAFVKTLAHMGADSWQFLPLHPTSTGIGNSPYSSPSAFAGNPLFISPEMMRDQGFLTQDDLDEALHTLNLYGQASGGHNALRQVDFEACTAVRERLFGIAYARCAADLPTRATYRKFCRAHALWLDDYALFTCIKREFEGAAWTEWPIPFKQRMPQALAGFAAHAAEALEREKFIQYLFFSQWAALRALCAEKGVRLVGDVPIYVTHDSADVWASPQLFHLDTQGQPVTVAGVPPDYFSATGQRWGSPIYRWQRMQSDGFTWWKARLGHELLLADTLRLDHFRGFCGYWEIPAKEETAINGAWKAAPGEAFFTAIRGHFGALPFIAEDLGVITQDVREVMERFALPGMHVLQFAFGGDLTDNPAVPYKHTRRSVVYTGTHDNMPAREWLKNSSEEEKRNLGEYLGQELHEHNILPLFLRLAFASTADLTVLPMQDALGFSGEHRMNIPGTSEGNWGWRMLPEEMEDARFRNIKELARIFGREGKTGKEGAAEDAPLYT